MMPTIEMTPSIEQKRARIHKMRDAICRELERQQHKARSHVFEFSPFSLKQKRILTWWCATSPIAHLNGIIADGAIRSGKTISMSLSYGLWAMNGFNLQNFLICGKTIGSLRRNVISIWKIMMIAQGYRIKDARTDNLLTVSKDDVTNYFYLFGGKDEQSQDLVQGITAAGVLFDEVALMPESFVNQATARCSIDGSKFFFNCNPEGLTHWFKEDWIDKRNDKRLAYLHFTMDDNASLSEETKERYRNNYSGMFYKRYILGQWCVAEGVIYDMFDPQANTYDDTLVIPRIGRHFVAVDYGTVNPMVYLDVWDTDQAIYIRKEYYYDSQGEKDKKDRRQKTDKEYGDDMEAFVENDMPIFAVVDPSAASFKVELAQRGIRVRDADNEVMDGIRMVSTLFSLKKLYVHKSCTNTINELQAYAWDEKAQKRGEEKPLKQNDHACDALRYFVKTIVNSRRLSRWAAKGVALKTDTNMKHG